MRLRRLLAWAAIGLLAGGALAAVVLVSAGSASRAAAQDATRTSTLQAVKTPVVKLKLVATGLSQPLGVTAPPGDTHRLFVVEKTGAVRIIENGKLLGTPFLNLRGLVSGGGEQGLLSLAFDPRYATNGRFYVFYTNLAGNIRVVRYAVSSADPNVANPGSAKVLWRVAHHAHANHNGGQLAFGPDGRLYIGIGDGGSEGDPNNYGQNVKVPYAKIWRLNVASSAPKPVLYAYGLRNPWRFSFDTKTGNLWIGDVGQNKWEEIDFLKAGTKPGTNFGWSYYEGDHVYKPQRIVRTRLVFPVTEYSHSVGCAVIGGYVYRGSAIAALRGDYVFADHCSGRVWFKTGPRAAAHVLTGVSQKVTNLTSFGQDASGALYLSSQNGSVYELVP
ncbi:MAG: PQQ-dependent sugar dehydrogenase [Thermoleophilia bacterium]